MTENGQTASIKTPIFTIDLGGRYTVMIMLFAMLTLVAGYVSYQGQQDVARAQKGMEDTTVKALNNLANEQRFTTCVLWITAGKDKDAALDEKLLRNRCWWLRKDAFESQSLNNE